MFFDVRTQETIIDSIKTMIDCWIRENCFTDATYNVNILKVFVNNI